jgi:acylglycerol lipase
VPEDPKALILMVHGYGNDSSWVFQRTAILFTEMGYAAFALDLPGHGLSEGLLGYIPSATDLVEDSAFWFNMVKSREEYRNLPRFLYGESLGGALCLLLHFDDPAGYDGAILMAPMCKISEKMKPPWPVEHVLRLLARWAPTLPIVPTADLVDKSVKDPAKRLLAKNNPRRYAGKPRLGTVIELLRVTASLEEKLKDVSLPFLVLHGDADVVTEPAVSSFLYESAKSEDKTIRIYEGMLHSLIQGEPDENVAIILEDISSWLKLRVQQRNSSGGEGAKELS